MDQDFKDWYQKRNLENARKMRDRDPRREKILIALSTDECWNLFQQAMMAREGNTITGRNHNLCNLANKIQELTNIDFGVYT